MKRKKSKSRIFIIWIVGIIAAILAIGYFTYYSANSEAKAKNKGGKPYYWCAAYKNGQVINRYCYGEGGTCQTYNLYNKKPKDDPKNGVTHSCYSEKVYVRRKGSPCPPADYVIENDDGRSIGCFGGFKEKNLKIIEKEKPQEE